MSGILNLAGNEPLLDSKGRVAYNEIGYVYDTLDPMPSVSILAIYYKKSNAWISNAIMPSANALATIAEHIYNDIPLSDEQNQAANLNDYGLDPSGYTANMISYIVKGDIVHFLESPISVPIGTVVYLPQQYGGHWYDGFKTSTIQRIQNHLMPAVKDALKEMVQ